MHLQWCRHGGGGQAGQLPPPPPTSDQTPREIDTDQRFSCLKNQWRSQRRLFGPCPPRPNTGGQYVLSSKTEAGPLDSLEPLAEIDFLSGFRTPWDGSGPRGSIRPLCRTNPGPTRWIRARKTNQAHGADVRSAPDCA